MFRELSFFRLGSILILIFQSILFYPLSSIGDEKGDQQNRVIEPASLIDSIQFKNTIKYCNNKIPLDSIDVKHRLEKEMLLSLWDRPQVILWVKRSAKFFPHIEKILKAYNLPLDLKYIPIIESALRPHASSSKGAVGYWQFLKSTGKRYGLRIDSQIDERRNIFKSTHAACKYFTSLYQRFDSYFLALAAYNMGEYGLKSEIEIQKSGDFFSLYLPLQTQRYVFKAIAAKLIIENHQEYGFSFNQNDLYPVFSFDTVNFKTAYKIPITLLSQSAGIPFKTIKDMNPDIRGYHLNKGNFSILIPKGKAKGFKNKFTTLYNNWEKTNKIRFHIVRSGDSLIGIANKYNVSVSSVLKRNNLTLKGVIHPGDRLVIE